MGRSLRLLSGGTALLAWLAQPLPAEAGFRTVFLSGQPAPGLPAGWEFDAFNLSNPLFQFDYPPLNAAGQSGIHALARNTLGPGISGGVWVGDGTGPLVLVALDHTPAPGLPGLGFSPAFPALSDAGDVAFPARLEGFGVGSVNDEALYGPSGSSPLAPLAREGSPAPGMAPGVVFGPTASSSTSPHSTPSTPPVRSHSRRRSGGRASRRATTRRSGSPTERAASPSSPGRAILLPEPGRASSSASGAAPPSP